MRFKIGIFIATMLLFSCERFGEIKEKSYPALAPNPDCTPNAKANGSATIPAVNPPKISPLILFFKKFEFYEEG